MMNPTAGQPGVPHDPQACGQAMEAWKGLDPGTKRAVIAAIDERVGAALMQLLPALAPLIQQAVQATPDMVRMPSAAESSSASVFGTGSAGPRPVPPLAAPEATPRRARIPVTRAPGARAPGSALREFVG